MAVSTDPPRTGVTAVSPDLAAAAGGNALDAAIVCWATDESMLERASPVPITKLWSDLTTDLPGRGPDVLAYPEVAEDFEQLAKHPQAAELEKKLREWLQSLRSGTSRAHMGQMRRHVTGLDLSDLRRHPLQIGGRGTSRNKPYRIVFSEQPSHAECAAILVVAVGEKIERADAVYAAKVGPRLGREPGVARGDGYWLEFRLALTQSQRYALKADFCFQRRPGDTTDAYESPRYSPARVTYMNSKSNDWTPDPTPWATDMVTLSCDYDEGRHLLRVVGDVALCLRCRQLPHELGF